MENNELRQHLNIDNIIPVKVWELLYSASVDGNAMAISNLYKRVVAGNVIAIERKDFLISKDTFQ